ncbi:RNA binding protein fox-1 homolog 3 isoform X4 [Tachysurus ichikawai]
MRKTSRYHMLCSMANTGCVLLSGSGLLPHSLQCPPAFLYLTELQCMLGCCWLCTTVGSRSGNHGRAHVLWGFAREP